MTYSKATGTYSLILAIIIVLALLLSSCGGAQNNTKDTTVATGDIGATEATTDELSARAAIPDDLPEKDFGGYTFRFYTNTNNDYGDLVAKFAPEGEIGEVVNDAVYLRNKTIEERFNITIQTVSSGDNQQQHTTKIKNSIMAGDDVFDAALVHCIWGPNLTLEGLAYNLLEVPYFNFNKPWWQKQTNEELTLNGRMYLGSNSIFYNGMASTKVVYFNKQLVQDYGIENPYQLVYDGKWTLDKLTELTKNVYEDINGNGEKDKEDRYGYVSFSIHNGFLVSCDIPVLEKGGDEFLKIVVNNEKTTTFVDKIYDWYYNSPGVYVDSDYESEWHQKLFANNQAVFAFGRIKDAINRYRASEVDYGILPLPKFDEAQENYRAFSVDEFFMVPSTVTQEGIERTGVILEAMSAEGYKQILPAFYEIALKNKYLNDKDSVRILDLINDCRTISFAYVYDNWQGFGHMCGQLFGDKPTRDFASFYEKRSTSAAKRLDAIIKGFGG